MVVVWRVAFLVLRSSTAQRSARVAEWFASTNVSPAIGACFAGRQSCSATLCIIYESILDPGFGKILFPPLPFHGVFVTHAKLWAIFIQGA
jgi:hypothetical protein